MLAKTLLIPFAAMALAWSVAGMPKPEVNEKSNAVFLPPNPDSDPNVTQGPDLSSYITSADAYCFFLPKTPQTSVALSIRRKVAISACREPWAPKEQLKLDPNFFTTNKTHPFVDNRAGKNLGRQIHLWGCINPWTMPDNLWPTDVRGGVYHGRIRGNDQNPARGVCLGYDHFTQWIKPGAGVISYKCCQDPIDCPRWDVDANIQDTIPDTNFNATACKDLIPNNGEGSSAASASSESLTLGAAQAGSDENGNPTAQTGSVSKNKNDANAAENEDDD